MRLWWCSDRPNENAFSFWLSILAQPALIDAQMLWKVLSHSWQHCKITSWSYLYKKGIVEWRCARGKTPSISWYSSTISIFIHSTNIIGWSWYNAAGTASIPGKELIRISLFASSISVVLQRSDRRSFPSDSTETRIESSNFVYFFDIDQLIWSLKYWDITHRQIQSP